MEEDKDSALTRLFKSLDAYGEKDKAYDPKKYRKTVSGGVITLLFWLLFCSLILFNLYKLISQVMISSFGKEIIVSRNQHGNPNQYMDIPTIELFFNNSVIFYEHDSPSLQAIKVIDGTGYSDNYKSTSNNISIAQAIYTQHQVPLNSFDQRFSSMTPEYQAHNDLDSGLSSSSYHSFSETLKQIYYGSNIAPAEFYNHTAHLFLRFQSSDLHKLKLCQLQAALYNFGELLYLDSIGVLNFPSYANIFPSLSADNSMWKQWAFENSKYLYETENIHVISRHYGTADLNKFCSQWDGLCLDSDRKFTNWGYSISYVNNFATINDITKCDGNSNFNRNYVPAIAPNSSSTILTINGLIDYDNSVTPFQMLISGVAGEEIVTIMHIWSSSGNTYLNISRTSNIDFTQKIASSNFPSYTTSWFCDPANYWNNDGCNCNCGAYDPDCHDSSQEVLNCPMNNICSYSGTCVSASMNLAYPNDNTVVMLSEACYFSLQFSGDRVTNGLMDYYSASASSCLVCPGDANGPYLESDGTEVCNMSPLLYVDGRTMALNRFGVSVQGSIRVVATIIQGKSSPALTNTQSTKQFQMTSAGVTSIMKFQANSDVSFSTTSSGGNLYKTDFYMSKGSGLRSYSGLGKLVSGVATDFNRILVVGYPSIPFVGLSRTFGSAFDQFGPYEIRVGGTSLIISSASEVDSVNNFQVLNVQSVSQSYNTYSLTFNQVIGQSSTLKFNASSGDTVLYVVPFPGLDWHTGIGTTLFKGGNFQMVIWNTDPTSTSGIEIVNVTDVDPPDWICDADYYNAGDGCDCSCGIMDPDCLDIYDYLFCYSDDYGICVNCFTSCSLPSNCTNSTVNMNVTIDPNAFKMKVYLSSPLTMKHTAGVRVDTYLDGYFNYNQITNKSNLDPYFDAFTWYELTTSVPDAYPISDRYNSHNNENFQSPSSLTVDAGLVIVPDRVGFDTLNLCPDINTGKSPKLFPQFNRVLFPGREMNIASCNLVKLSSDSCIDVSESSFDDFNHQCINQMPPTYQFEYQVVYPLNNKFYSQVDELNFPPDLQFEVDFEYTFSHDQRVIQAENQFAVNMNSNGDTVIENGHINGSTSSIHYFVLQKVIGPGGGSDQNIPANVPYHVNSLTLQVNETLSLADIKRFLPIGYPTDSANLKLLLENFPKVNLTWDFNQIGGSTVNQTIPLIVGNQYILEATLNIVPVYFSNMLEILLIQNWTVAVTSSTVSILPLDFLHRQQAIVKYKIYINGGANQIINSYATDVKSFIDSCGSAAGYIGFGIMVVIFWHTLTKLKIRMINQKEAEIQMKEKERTEKIKESLLAEFNNSTLSFKKEKPKDKMAEIKSTSDMMEYEAMEDADDSAYMDAEVAYRKGNYQAAIDILSPLANSGHEGAQNLLGNIYKSGKGVAKDYQKAFKYYKMAADKGNRVGQANLAMMYQNGLGCDADVKMSEKLLRMAADKGNEVAQNNIGVMCENGIHGKQDFKEAMKYYKMSANQGNALGQFFVADMYLNGKGVEKDIEMAKQMFELSAAQGNQLAKERLASLKK